MVWRVVTIAVRATERKWQGLKTLPPPYASINQACLDHSRDLPNCNITNLAQPGSVFDG